MMPVRFPSSVTSSAPTLPSTLCLIAASTVAEPPSAYADRPGAARGDDPHHLVPAPAGAVEVTLLRRRRPREREHGPREQNRIGRPRSRESPRIPRTELYGTLRRDRTDGSGSH